MTQLSVMDLAKQGDPQAIAALINRSLASKGIHAEAQLEADCLNISLKAVQTPNQKAVVAIIHRGMMILQVDRIKRVKIFTYRSDNNYLAWQYELVLDESLKDDGLKLADTNAGDQVTSAQGDDLAQEQGQSQNMNLVSNPRGAILVQKLSQIQRNLQEYQDIIVRFTDEQVGTVKCLTTLNELIHVVSKPSFLFTAVAANPSLRGLLDAIAESSRTDEHGDQVISNLSILQPGQQWQKAKIRLVSKIFLEPDQEGEEDASAETRHQGITVDLEETAPPQVIYREEPAIAPIITPVTTPIQPPAPIPAPTTTEALASDSPDSIEKAIAATDTVEPEPITLNELSFLGDDFGDSAADIAPAPSQTVNSPVSEPISTPMFTPPALNLDMPEQLAASSNNLTVSSLFDDFGEDAPPVKIIDDVTEIETPDSLFEQFASHSSAAPIASYQANGAMNGTVNAVSEADESDLFGSFSAETPSPAPATPYLGNNNLNFLTNNEDETVLQEDIAILKARIPKQSLDNLLTLMQEEDSQRQGSGQASNSPSQELENSMKTDIGASTIEQILGNMETITLKPSNASANFVTLEDFSEDLESVGF